MCVSILWSPTRIKGNEIDKDIAILLWIIRPLLKTPSHSAEVMALTWELAHQNKFHLYHPTTWICVSSWLPIQYSRLSRFVLIHIKPTWNALWLWRRWSRLDEPNFMAGLKPLTAELGSRHRLERCWLCLTSSSLVSTWSGSGDMFARVCFGCWWWCWLLGSPLENDLWKCFEAPLIFILVVAAAATFSRLSQTTSPHSSSPRQCNFLDFFS